MQFKKGNSVTPKSARSAGSATEFLNVDLELRSKSIPPRLVSALEGRTIVLHKSKTLATFELETQPSSIDRAFAGFARLVRGLSTADRAAWDACSSRQFNIGIKAGTRPPSKEFEVSPATLEAALEIGASLAFTVYAAEGE